MTNGIPDLYESAADCFPGRTGRTVIRLIVSQLHSPVRSGDSEEGTVGAMVGTLMFEVLA